MRSQRCEDLVREGSLLRYPGPEAGLRSGQGLVNLSGDGEMKSFYEGNLDIGDEELQELLCSSILKFSITRRSVSFRGKKTIFWPSSILSWESMF